jgi:hypothetical protein
LEDPYEVRFAKRFALAYAAALLAIRYGAVLWDQEIVYRSIRRVYRKARSQTARPVDRLQAAVKRVIRRVRAANAVDLTAGGGQFNAARARVLLKMHTDGKPLRAVRSDYFRRLVGPKVDPRKVARELEHKGLLIPRSNGRRTRQIPIPGSKKRIDCYCLRLPESKASSHKGRAKNAALETE